MVLLLLLLVVVVVVFYRFKRFLLLLFVGVELVSCRRGQGDKKGVGDKIKNEKDFFFVSSFFSKF